MVLFLMQPGFSQVKNLDYNRREIIALAHGSTAKEALHQTALEALKEALSDLTQTELERQALVKVQPHILKDPERYLKRLKIIAKGTTESGRYYRVLYAVDLKRLRTELVHTGVLRSQSELVEALRYPKIMAYYADSEKDTYSLWAVERVHHFLLHQGYQVVDQSTQAQLLAEDQALAGAALGKRQGLALKSQADIFMEVRLKPQVMGKSGDFVYVQTPVLIKAYESAAATPFIEKVYQRLDKKGEPEALAIKSSEDLSAKVVIEEAVAGVMPLVNQDLLHHWKQALKKGSQYKVFVALNAEKRAFFEGHLETLCTAVEKRSDREYWVRSKKGLDELSDLIEARVESKGCSLEKFKSGSAYFSCE